MKNCPYCKAQIPEAAIRCQCCTAWLEHAETEKPSGGSVVFVVDQGLLRFAKFAVGILAIFLIVGMYLWGFELKDTLKEFKGVREEMLTIRTEIGKQREAIKADRGEVDRMMGEVKSLQATTADAAASSYHGDSASTTIAMLPMMARTMRAATPDATAARDRPPPFAAADP